MMMLVADSSALILLAKCSLLGTPCGQYEVTVPTSVLSEVASEALIGKHPDASLIGEVVADRKIKIRDPESVEFRMPISLHQGEKDALVLARQQKDSLFATDDAKAVKAARFLKIPFIVTPKIVVELGQLGKIPLKKARESLEKLAIVGRYSPGIISEAMLALMEQIDVKTNNHQNT